MIKQDYLLRMIEEIISMIVIALLGKKKSNKTSGQNMTASQNKSWDLKLKNLQTWMPTM